VFSLVSDVTVAPQRHPRYHGVIAEATAESNIKPAWDDGLLSALAPPPKHRYTASVRPSPVWCELSKMLRVEKEDEDDRGPCEHL
jgi:hypothetical protein